MSVSAVVRAGVREEEGQAGRDEEHLEKMGSHRKSPEPLRFSVLEFAGCTGLPRRERLYG